jgi:hypothetical protein
MDGIPASHQIMNRYATQAEASIPVVPVTIVSAVPVASAASPVEAHAVNNMERKAAPVSPVASPAPQAASGSRTMIVELPADVYPFAVINVQAPDGLTISVCAVLSRDLLLL